MNGNNDEMNTEILESTENIKSADNEGFKFFKNCSSSLKRFSVLIFGINIFLIIVAVVISLVLIALKIGTELLSVLIIPIISASIILIVLSRFISALIYGFAEIVEKYEK